MKSFCFVLLALLVYWGWFIYTTFEFGKEVAPLKQNCVPLRGPLGAEDVMKWKNVVLTTSVDSLALWNWPGKQDPSVSDPTVAQPGAIYAIKDIGTDKPYLEKLEMVNFPAGVAFHPHGFGLFYEQDLLFVVNHAYAAGGERVDVFHLKEEGDKIKLVYQSTVNFAPEQFGVMNDVVPVSKDEFYVTQYLPYGDAEKGRPTSIIHKLKNILQLATPLELKLTDFFYCKGTSGFSKDLCRKVGPKGGMWNGITTDGKTLYVYDLAVNSVIAFSRAENGDVTEIRRYPITHRGDNIQFDKDDGQIWTGGMAHVFQGFFRWLQDYEEHPGRVPTGGASPSGFYSPGHVSSLNLETGKVTTHVLHDGSLLGTASSGARIGNKFVMGSFADDGVLICDPEK